jgi:hypothetical protein
MQESLGVRAAHFVRGFQNVGSVNIGESEPIEQACLVFERKSLYVLHEFDGQHLIVGLLPYLIMEELRNDHG